MSSLAIYCKSYSTDLLRLVRLAQSVSKFNREKIPFHVSVPALEYDLFSEHLRGLDVQLHCDEDILRASGLTDLERFNQLHGAIGQQIVKSSFWKLLPCEAYVCLDSDAIFIRPFGVADFIAPDGVPYTVIDEAHELLDDARNQGKFRVIDAHYQEAQRFQSIFARNGRAYSFGPFPLVWHRLVWESLETEYLNPRNMHLIDAIESAPIESRWYGEALLKYQAIPLRPCQALFKVYHYAWQFDQERGNRRANDQLANSYLGVIYQSAWERNMDWPKEGGSIFSRFGRRLRRLLGRI